MITIEAYDRLIASLNGFYENFRTNGNLILNAAAVCQQMMEGDTLSQLYTRKAEALVTEMANNVMPPLQDALDYLGDERKRLWHILHPEDT